MSRPLVVVTADTELRLHVADRITAEVFIADNLGALPAVYDEAYLEFLGTAEPLVAIGADAARGYCADPPRYDLVLIYADADDIEYTAVLWLGVADLIHLPAEMPALTARLDRKGARHGRTD